ncbi:MAG: RidA family protein [Gracilibacteraceae bacterium]|jgi:2-iminobutanoate/2-iminopropanoate deaminase|nr:RidA family protein [Gracilibacteraceae bacterium]
MKTVFTPAAPAAIGPYSQATVAGGFVFTSGQLGLVPDSGLLCPGGTGEQTAQAIENLRAVLTAAGSDLSRVVKTTCFLSDLNDFALFNSVYEKYFTGKPARSCVQAAALPKGALVEIEAVAEA